ncbi:MAG: ribosome-associated translation inhibitor RaiA [Oscillospiraceae bacterium]|jgi:putative sigma-54 modulation protein|nr:ribosome-associated translation inhibitor RaiA [Oscillospiraceae bacterium]
MKMTIVGRKCQAGPAFQAHAEKKLNKLQRLLGPGAEEADAKITATAQKTGIVVEVTVRFQDVVLRAEEGAQQINDALDHCVDVLVRQLRKNKTRMEKRIHAVQLTDFLDAESVEEETDFAVARSKAVFCKPIDVEEAILQMNLVGHQFYLFLNAETDSFNLVYRRRGGDYGLLIPERE